MDSSLNNATCRSAIGFSLDDSKKDAAMPTLDWRDGKTILTQSAQSAFPL